MGKRILGALVGVAVLIGMKFYNKSSSHDEVRARLVELCAGDASCGRAVEQHFESCFDASYKLGGRRQSSHLEAEQLVSCINSRSGKEHFTFDKDAK